MTEASRATIEVVDSVTGLSFDDFPVHAVELAKRCIIDGLAVVLAGSTTPGSTILRAYVLDNSSRPEATVLGAGAFRTCAASAALLNGASGHAMDFDDTQ